MICPTRIWPRITAHADMDAFYAAIEQLDDPALRGRPILVGSPSDRGVVLTASYEARPYGVGSAMPMAQARRKCPNALIIPPRCDRYQQVSKMIMEAFADFSPHVEALSLDEAFLDMTGSEELFGAPELMGHRLKMAIREVTGRSHGVGRLVGDQVRGESCQRVPQARRFDRGSTRKRENLARSTSRVSPMGCRPQDPRPSSPTRLAYDRQRIGGRS